MGKTHVDYVELTNFSANPTDTNSSRRAIASVGTDLKFFNGTSWSILGTSGGSTSSWEGIFGADQTFTITPDTTWEIAGNRSTATDVVTMTNIAGGSGDVLKIQNTGTGADISGTDDTWTVTKAGAATFVGVTPGGDVTSTSTAIDWDLQDNVSSALSFDTAGAAGLLEFDTTNTSEVVKFGKDLQITDGIGTFISTSNTVSNVLVTNNTVTSFGADANSAGVVVIRSTSLDTGSLLQLQLTEGTLSGGFYLTARDVTGSSNVLTIGEDGAVVIAGIDATNVLTLTLGDAVISNGSLSVTDTDNATTVSVVNNTVTTAATTFDVSSTSITTGSLMRLNANTVAHDGEVLEIINAGDTTSTGTGISVTMPDVTTGAATGIDVVMVGLTTTGFGIKVTMDAITDGDMLYLDNGGATMTSTGNFILCNDDNTSKFRVSLDGATTIAGNAALTAALTLTAGDVVITDGLIQHAVDAGVTANTGSVQGNSPITKFYTEISVTAGAGDAVTLPTAVAGRMVLVTNHGANAADVFPASGDTLNEGTVDIATSCAVNETLLFVAYDATNWEAIALARN